LRFGWKTTFLVTGSLGFIWLALWLMFYETPERHRAITPEEYALIKEGDAETRRGSDAGKERRQEAGAVGRQKPSAS
jgi:ACS family hexuronate transporter-like MFS transporter